MRGILVYRQAGGDGSPKGRNDAANALRPFRAFGFDMTRFLGRCPRAFTFGRDAANRQHSEIDHHKKPDNSATSKDAIFRPPVPPGESHIALSGLQIIHGHRQGKVAVEFNNGSLSESLENNLRHNVVSTLHQSGYQQHRTLEITVDHGTVTVEGGLPTYYLRQVALECIRRVTGVTGVVDRIQVVRESQDDDSIDSKYIRSSAASRSFKRVHTD